MLSPMSRGQFSACELRVICIKSNYIVHATMCEKVIPLTTVPQCIMEHIRAGSEHCEGCGAALIKLLMLPAAQLLHQRVSSFISPGHLLVLFFFLFFFVQGISSAV